MSGKRIVPVDHEARERAISDHDTSLCLEAGAGTGKTTILVERFLSIIRSGRADCSSVAAITFTEKAASEMKERLFTRIEEVLEDGLPDVERERLEKARDELERAQISTIHAFASSILREFPLEAGVDPSFENIDEFDTSIFMDESFGEFLARRSERHEDALRKLMPLGRPSKCVEFLRSLTFHYYYERVSRALGGIFEETSSGAVPAVTGRFDPESHRDHLLSSARRLRSIAEAGCVSPDDAGREEIEDFAAETRHLEGLGGDRLAARLLSVTVPKAKGNQSNWSPPESCREQKGICRDIQSAHAEYCCAYMDDLRGSLEDWCVDFLDYVEARKRQAGVLDFDDLLIKARKLLDNGGALEALRARYAYILVDEFQDTDPLQAEIIVLLAGRPGSPGLDPEPGKLFVVGDPKQSIYRFRRADIEIYEQVRESIARSGAVLKITQNFRSVPGVIGWVNRAFDPLMKRPGDGMYMPRYIPVHAVREDDGPAVFSLRVETASSKVNDFRREEGRTVASLIREIVDSGRTVLDPVTKKKREVRYGDIALVYRSTTGVEFYEDPLREAGIPYLVEGGKLYYTRQEVRDISNAVWVIEDPYDSAALLAMLRSPLFGFSDEEIFLFSRAGGELCYIGDRMPEEEGFEDFGRAYELLRRLHSSRNSAGPVATLRALLAETGYLSSLKLRIHGEQRVLNLRKTLQTARLFEEKMHSFRHFARWMRDQDVLGAAEGESPAVDEDENAVRMITIHKAKGLQFPVVIMVNLVQGMHGPGGLITRRGGMPSIRFNSLETSDFREAVLREGRMDEAETVRMLYVAATRAGDMLVIPRAPEKKRGSPPIYRFLAPALEDVDAVEGADLPALPEGAGPFTVMPAVKPRDVAAAAAARERWAAERRELLAAGASRPVPVTPSGLERFEAETEGGVPSDPDRALRFGSAFHKMMELSLQGPSPPDTEVAAKAAAASEGAEDMETAILELGGRVLASALIGKAKASERLIVEPPFSAAFEGGTLSGRADLVFREGDAWTVLDFKTDDVTAEEVPARLEAYRPQGAAYAWALDRLGISPVGRVVFYFVRPGIEASIEAGPGLLAEGERLVRSARPEDPPSPS